jgi:hypothetical protein
MDIMWGLAVSLCFIAALLDKEPIGRLYGYVFVFGAFLPEFIMPFFAHDIYEPSDELAHGLKYLIINAIVFALMCLVYLQKSCHKSCLYIKRCLWGGYLLLFALMILVLEYFGIRSDFDIILALSTVYYAICAYTIYKGRTSDGDRISFPKYIIFNNFSLRFAKRYFKKG